MRNGHRLWLLLLCTILAVAPVASAAPQPAATSPVYMPLVQAAAGATPTRVIVQLPFVVLNSIQPEPVWVGDAWLFSVFRVDGGDDNGGYLLRWRPGDTAASVVATGAATRGAITPGRGSVVLGPDGWLYWFGYGDGRTRELIVQQVLP